MIVECPTCHGEGVIECRRGCHSIECPECYGTGEYEVPGEEMLS